MKSSILGVNIDFFLNLLLLMISYSIPFPFFNLLGTVSILCFFMLVWCTAILNYKLFVSIDNSLYYIIFSYYTFVLISHFNILSLYNYGMQLSIFVFVFSLMNFALTERSFNRMKTFFNVLFYLLLFYAVFAICTDPFVMHHEFSLLLYASSFFIMYCIKKKRNVLIFSLLLAGVMALKHERNLMLATALVGISYFFLSNTKLKKNILSSLFLVYLLMVLLFPFFYVFLYLSPYAEELNNYTVMYTGKGFFSGRQMLWVEAWQKLGDNYLFGLGLDSGNLIYHDIVMSTHNLYLSLFMQSGAVGVLLYMLFLFLIWKKLLCNLNVKLSCISISFLLSIMLLADFGMLLLGNLLLPSIMLWLVVGIGMMKNKIVSYEY